MYTLYKDTYIKFMYIYMCKQIYEYKYIFSSMDLSINVVKNQIQIKNAHKLIDIHFQIFDIHARIHMNTFTQISINT